MKTINLLIMLSLITYSAVSVSSTHKPYTFNYKPLKDKAFAIKVSASSYETAFKLSAKECFQKLTQGQYPGEEKGLDIIDVCANPKS
jgi:hypothetical protein